MKFSETLKAIKSDAKTHGGRSFMKFIYIYLFDARFRLLLNYRLGNYFKNNKFKLIKLLAAYYKYRQITKRNCQISYGATIGKGVKFLHPLGIVIGDKVIVGDNVSIWQQVTLGSHGKPNEEINYPIVKNNVKIFAGAKIIGSVVIEEGAIIGANAVVNKSVPASKIAVGVPAIIKNLNS